MLEVRLLGKFAIACDGEPVTITSRAAQSLFAYLILTAGTMHRREKLAGMFWPDTSEEKARANLRYELWRIRKAFPGGEFLVSNNIGIAFDASMEYWLDAMLLERLTDTASADELIAALSAFEGELLPGFYENWIVLEREHLQAVYEQKLTQLMALLESEKRWQEILAWGERWISLGQGPEAAYRYLMTAYDALGDRAKVASTYKRCVQVLRELDLEPSEQTRALAIKRTHLLNIPIPLTSFIGREKELREVVSLLSTSRLVTLLGSGGVGKTRLSLHVVADVLDKFPDGVWFLDLAPLTDPALVPNTLANLIGLRESGDTKLATTDLLINYFQSRTALVIFDNCEHLIAACAQLVNSLLTACEHLSVLATSREALRLAGEHHYRVPSLEIPKQNIDHAIDAIDVLARIESVRLFTERAAFVSPGFRLSPQNALTISQICRRLDGIPLAIELAAARINMMAVEQMLNRLDDRFNLLTSGWRTALPRHQTLQATIEWSYSLLSEEERLLFRRLAIFIGGWTLEAAEIVCTGSVIQSRDILELLSQLVNKSLVVVESTEGAHRYHRLETIRQFAREKLLVSGEFEMMHHRHLDYFLQLAERAEPEIRSHNQVVWLNNFENEIDNLRVALKWSQKHDAELCLRLVSALWRFWDIRGYADEGLEWLTKTLRATESIQTKVRASALARASQLAGNNGYLKQAESYANDGYGLAKKLDDKASMARALLILSTLEIVRSREQTGLEFLQEALNLSREIEDHGLVASILFNFGFQARNRDLAMAISYLEQGLQEARISGDKRLISHGLQQLSLYFLMQGNTGIAKSLVDEAYSLTQAMDDKANIMGCHWLLATIALFSESYGTAEEHSMKAEQIARLQNDKQSLSISLKYLSLVSWAKNDYSRFRELTQEALLHAKERSDQFLVTELLVHLGEAFRLKGDLAQARITYEEALTILGQENFRSGYCVCLEGIAALTLAEGQIDRAARLLGAREKLREITFVMDNSFVVDTYPFLIEQREALIENTRLQLGDEAFMVAWQAGREMSLEQVLAYMTESIR